MMPTHPTAAQVLDLLVETLARHSNFSMNDNREIRRLRPKVSNVERGADIVRQGDRPKLAIMVVSGMLARYHTAPNGDRQYLSLHIAGDLPDLQSLFLGIMDHSVCALDETQIAAFAHSEIQSLVRRAPSAGLAFWRHTLIDAAIFRQAITSNGRRSAVARVAHLFCEQFTRARAALCVRLVLPVSTQPDANRAGSRSITADHPQGNSISTQRGLRRGSQWNATHSQLAASE